MTTTAPTTPVKEKKPFTPSLWQQHLSKVIEEKKGRAVTG